MHLQLSLAATAIATLVALPLGLWLGHIGRYQFLADEHVEHRPRRAGARR